MRSNGDTSFEDMDVTVPFIEVAQDLNVDLDENINWFPRAYKTHFHIDCVPKGAKYICVLRNPYDIILSWYNFVRNWALDSSCTLDDFVKYIIMEIADATVPLPSIWNGILSLYNKRFDSNCLLLHYEDFLCDRMSCIKLISDFMEIDASDQLIQKVYDQSSIEFMKKRKSKFDIHTLKININPRINLDKYAGINTNNGTVRNGIAGLGKKAMSQESIDLIEGMWNKYIKSNVGFRSYDQMRKSVNIELGRNFF